jgi:hypothetical protein
MSNGALACPKCGTSVVGAVPPLTDPQPCPSCRRPFGALTFPAWQRVPTVGRNAEAILTADEAGCFFHPQSRAQVPCDTCGRFLCALCDVPLGGRHLCPDCLNSGTRRELVSQMDNGRTLYGGIAFLVALLPLLIFWPFTIATGLLSVFLAIYFWHKPQSLTGPRRGIYVVTILLGLGQFAVWALIVFGLVFRL